MPTLLASWRGAVLVGPCLGPLHVLCDGLQGRAVDLQRTRSARGQHAVSTRPACATVARAWASGHACCCTFRWLRARAGSRLLGRAAPHSGGGRPGPGRLARADSSARSRARNRGMRAPPACPARNASKGGSYRREGFDLVDDFLQEVLQPGAQLKRQPPGLAFCTQSARSQHAVRRPGFRCAHSTGSPTVASEHNTHANVSGAPLQTEQSTREGMRLRLPPLLPRAAMVSHPSPCARPLPLPMQQQHQ